MLRRSTRSLAYDPSYQRGYTIGSWRARSGLNHIPQLAVRDTVLVA